MRAKGFHNALLAFRPSGNAGVSAVEHAAVAEIVAFGGVKQLPKLHFNL